MQWMTIELRWDPDPVSSVDRSLESGQGVVPYSNSLDVALHFARRFQFF